MRRELHLTGLSRGYSCCYCFSGHVYTFIKHLVTSFKVQFIKLARTTTTEVKTNHRTLPPASTSLYLLLLLLLLLLL